MEISRLKTNQDSSTHRIESEETNSIVVRFAGDSGDGIQLTGDRFSTESAVAGNDLATLPNYPAEIRAPAGSLAGVSGFQIHFGSQDIHTPGDTPDVLVVMNPAALKANLNDLPKNGILIANEDSFTSKNLSKVNYASSPLEDSALKEDYRVITLPISQLTKEAVKESGVSSRDAERCKNFFTLGVVLWMFNRPYQSTLQWIEDKFRKRPDLVQANTLALKAGRAYAEATEIFNVSYIVPPAEHEAGEYRNLNGTISIAYGLVAAARKSGLPLFVGAYPITPASDLLHELAKHKKLGVSTFQAEDEISAICSSIGAAYAGSLAVTSSSGPGIALKLEAMSLAAMVELPLVIVNNQRGGPSTGLPTKTEQSDLMQALYGRHGESPVCVIAASSIDSAFSTAYEACRIALKYMTPVILLSDGYINNCSGPWMIPDPTKLKPIDVNFYPSEKAATFAAYSRDESTLARPWAIPGTPGLEHRVGGLEKENLSGDVSYDPDNHALMSKLRAEKIEKIAQEIPKTIIDGDEKGDLLIVGWGGTEGTLKKTAILAREEGIKVSRIHLQYINPLPGDLGEILKRFKKILVPEINLGQLNTILRNKYLVDSIGLNIVRGQPIKISEVLGEIRSITGSKVH